VTANLEKAVDMLLASAPAHICYRNAAEREAYKQLRESRAARLQSTQNNAAIAELIEAAWRAHRWMAAQPIKTVAGDRPNKTVLARGEDEAMCIFNRLTAALTHAMNAVPSAVPTARVDAENLRRYAWLRDNCYINRSDDREFPHAIIRICLGLQDSKTFAWMYPGHTRGVGVPTLDEAIDAVTTFTKDKENR
jgi:hypothetical protein